MSRLDIVIPAYNEAANIAQVVGQWYPVVTSCGDGSLIVLDDGSTDETARILRALARSRPALRVVEKDNEGHGATVLRGYRLALEDGADYVFQTDSDGQTDPDDFPAFWARRESYDAVMGVRASREDGLSRVCVTNVLKAVVDAFFHVRVPDANVPFRLVRADALTDALELVPEGYGLANAALSVSLFKLGYSVEFLPIAFHARQGGENSIDIPRIVRIGARACAEFSRLNRSMDEKARARRRES